MQSKDEKLIRQKDTRPDRKIRATLLRQSLKILVAATLLSGCSQTGETIGYGFHVAVPLNPTAEGLPSVARLPLTMGVYYDDKFRSYEYDYLFLNGQHFHYPVGQASVTLFDQVFPVIFKDVSGVTARPPLPPGQPNVAAVIEPAIENFDVKIGFSPPTVFHDKFTEITYRFTLWSPQGERIASWTVTGSGDVRRDSAFKPLSDPAVAHQAMRDAALKFLTVFRAVPEVRQWLRETGVEGATGIH